MRNRWIYSAPKRAKMLLETRTMIDAVRMLGPLTAAQLMPGEKRDDLLVIVIPGFGADDRYTAPLRHYLQRRGFEVEGWGLGRNLAGMNMRHSIEALSDGWQVEMRPDYRGEACVPFLCDRVADQVRERAAATGKPVALVGWSLGGYLAREAARDLPDIVDRVVTMGAPITGGPKYTAAASFFTQRGMDLDWIEEEVLRREEQPITQPVTAIYSKSDAIVDWKATLDKHNESVEHVEINGAHLGMAFNPTIWRQVVKVLEPVAGERPGA